MNTIERYYNIHCLVQRYQNDKSLAYKIIYEFRFFLNKHLIFLLGKKKRMVDNEMDIRKLVCLYSKCKFKKTLYYLSPKYMKHLYNTCDSLFESIKDITQEELLSIMIIAFLKLCNSYKDTRPSFHNYVQNNFCYRFYELLVLCLRSNKLVSIDDMDFIDYTENKNYDYLFNNLINKRKINNSIYNYIENQESNDMYSDSFFDNKWINGVTCNYPFTKLTQFERRIIKLHYVDKLTDEQISNMLGLNRIYVMRRRNRALEKIE